MKQKLSKKISKEGDEFSGVVHSNFDKDYIQALINDTYKSAALDIEERIQKETSTLHGEKKELSNDISQIRKEMLELKQSFQKKINQMI